MIFFRRPRFRILLPSALFLAIAVLLGLMARHISTTLAAESATKPAPVSPVIVELFTSEGCSSCPPADALLGRLQRDQPVASAQVLALEEHVDYWDGLGWHDRFSSADITSRQSVYARRFQLDSNYTPQMVVDGASQFVGNDSMQAVQAVTRAARTPKLPLSIQALMIDGDHIVGQVAVPASAPADADLYVALIQPMASTQVLHGENGGHTLNHVSVVRHLQHVSRRSGTNVNFSITIPRDLPHPGLRIIVFLQTKGQGPVLGAAWSTLPSSSQSGAVAVPK